MRKLATTLLFVTVASLRAAETVATIPTRDYRIPVRKFVQSAQEDIYLSTGIPMAAWNRKSSLKIIMRGGRTKEPSIASGAVTVGSDGRVCGMVSVIRPDAIRPMQLRFAVAQAVMKSEICARASGGRSPTFPPDWFVRGVALHSDSLNRGRVFEEAYGHWSRGNLPRVDLLVETNSSCATAFPSVAAQIVAWVVDSREREAKWERLLNHLAAGNSWRPDAFFLNMLGTVSFDRLDDSFDDWMHERGRRIFRPGLTSRGAIRRFRLSLIFFPFDRNYPLSCLFDGTATFTLSELLEKCDNHETRLALKRRASRYRRSAFGRDSEFKRICGLFAEAAELGAEGQGRLALEKAREAEKALLELDISTIMN